MPYYENTDDLVLDFNDDESIRTQTFGIKINTIKEDEDSDEEYFIGNKIDDLEALKQSIYLQLSIEADQYVIYTHKYGLKTLDLIGKNYQYVISVLPNRIRETLKRDDRITDVTDFTFSVERNKVFITFTVKSIYGDVKTDTVVRF